MNEGDFDDYQHDGDNGRSSSSSVQDDDIYQIYEELVGVVQDHYDGLENGESLSKTSGANAEAAGKGGARPKWNKQAKDDDKHVKDADARGDIVADGIMADSDSDSDEIGDRNPNASPIVMHGKKA